MIEKLFHLKKNNTNAHTEGDRRIDDLYDAMAARIGSRDPTMLSAAGIDSTAVLMRNLSGFFCGNHGNEQLFTKLSICSGAGNGIECLFCIHSMWQYGVFLESGIDGSIC